MPPGVDLVSYYDQSRLVDNAVSTVRNAMLLGALLVLISLFVFLGNIRSAIIVALALPLCASVAFMLMGANGMSANLMSLGGIAVQNGLVLVSHIVDLIRAGAPPREAIIEGAANRLRPVLMTALTTMLGLTPLLLSTGMGSEVQRPLALVVVAGLLSSTFLTLIMIPALFEWFSVRRI